MLPKVPTKTQKRTDSPPPTTLRIENEYNPETVPQYFQVTVNVLEATKLTWYNRNTNNSYVIVTLGKKRRKTAVRRNMEEPYYRELYTSLREIQTMALRLTVMELRCCGRPMILGQCDIDLSAVWNQPHHQVFRKWAQLLQPTDQAAGPSGFLKIDISIVFRGEVQHIPLTLNEDKFEENLLFPSGTEQQRASYMVTIYSGFSLSNGTHCYGDTRYGKQPSTFVRVTYCGLVAKTGVQHVSSNPSYNETITFIEMFPNMSQRVIIEVCAMEGCVNKVLCSTQLRLDQISHDGENGFLPTFGPSLIHMYGPTCTSTLTSVENGPYHRGALLISFKTVVPYYQLGYRTVSIEPTQSVIFDNIWSLEDFCTYCALLEVSMLDRKVAGKVSGVALTIGDIGTNSKSDKELLKVLNEIRSKRLHYTGQLPVTKTTQDNGYLQFTHAFPILQQVNRLPDFRFRMYRNNMIEKIVNLLKTNVEEIERRLRYFDYKSPSDLSVLLNKALDDTAAHIQKYLDDIKYSNMSNGSSNNVMRRFSNELDLKQSQLRNDEIQRIYQSIVKKRKYMSAVTHNTMELRSKNNSTNSKVSRKLIKMDIADIRQTLISLEKLIFKSSEGWPDIIIWLLNGGSRVAFCKIPISTIIYSATPEQCGRNCAQMQTLYMTPLKCPKHMATLATGCFCIAAKLDVCLWMSLFRHRGVFEKSLPNGYTIITKDFDMCLKAQSMILECRCFIYRAKLNSGFDKTGLADPFLRINVLNSSKDTEIKKNTLTPVWDQVLTIQKMVFSSIERLLSNPPIVLVEVYDNDAGNKNELIGRVPVQTKFLENNQLKNTQPLQWYEIYKGIECTGQILMALQLAQIPETQLKTTFYTSVDDATIPEAANKKPKEHEGTIERIPTFLIPEFTSYKLDVYWWGLRDVAISRKPCIVFEMDDLKIRSEVILEKKTNCNFPNGKSTHIFEAPLKDIYCPPISLKLYDSSTFGRTIFLGTNVVKNPNKYLVNWLPKDEREASLNTASFMSSNFSKANPIVLHAKLMEQSLNLTTENDFMGHEQNPSNLSNKLVNIFGRKRKTEEEFTLLPVTRTKSGRLHRSKYGVKAEEDHIEKDWWMRFFCSQKECLDDDRLNEKDKIMIYNSELECQPGFSKFKDWCSTLKLYNGKKTGIPEKDMQLYCGFLKAGIAIYRWPPPANTIAVSPSGVDLNKGFFDDHPSNDSTKFLVRVYIVKGFNLLPKDFSGKSDPYVMVHCGKKKFGDRRTYTPKTLNPVFGKMYEFRCSLPEDYLLTVAVYDYNCLPPDDTIGCTGIDLEDRIYSKHRGTCGIASTYSQTSPYKWRDCMRPSVILEQLCSRNHIPPPIFTDATSVLVNGVEYKNGDDKFTSPLEHKESICLNILHQWQTLPICGYQLVPEHVETRTLFNPDKPGMDQGKIQMWVDIFPLDSGYIIPPPVDITIRKAREYELRVIVWDVEGVKLDDYDIITGQQTSDIYVRGWIGHSEQAQQTDIHYRSLSGVGNFNWRMIFRFNYQHAQRKMVVKDTSVFTEVEELMPPFLFLQVLDSDMISADDYLGSLTLNLNSMPRGAKSAGLASIGAHSHTKNINLFSKYSIRGWWPLKPQIVNEKNSKTPAAVIDLELTLLPKERALLMPVGLGRDPPHPLPPPNRPDTSFNIFKSPFLVLKALFRKKGYKILIYVALVIFIGGFFIILYFDLPGILLQRWLGHKSSKHKRSK